MRGSEFNVYRLPHEQLNKPIPTRHCEESAVLRTRRSNATDQPKVSLRGVRCLADDEAIPWSYDEIATPPFGGSQ